MINIIKNLKENFFTVLSNICSLYIWLKIVLIIFNVKSNNILPPKFLVIFFVVIYVIICIYYILHKKIFDLIWNLILLLFFPLIIFFEYLFKFFNSTFCKKIFKSYLFCCSPPIIFFFVLFFFFFQSVLFIEKSKILNVLIAFLNIIITIQITSSVLIWVYKPFEPLEKLQIIIIKIFNFLLNIPIYNYRIIIRNYNYKDIVNILNLLKSLKRLIEIFREKIKKITLRENILIYFSVVFLLLFIIVLFGYGGAIYSLNRFDGIYNKYILFKDLPPNSSYFKSIFQSFVIMISGQDITLGNTTVLGRIIYIFEVFNMLFLFGFILTVFFTSVNFKDNIYSNNLDSVFETILKKLSEVIDDIEGSLKPMILNKENIKYD